MTQMGTMDAGTDRAGALDLASGVAGAAAALVLWLFWRDATHLMDIWWTSTTYGHCLFIGPVVGWLVWQRRASCRN